MYKPDKRKIIVKMAEAGIGSYKELAARTGDCVNTISRLNNGGSAQFTTLQALAGALDCEPAELLEDGRVI